MKKDFDFNEYILLQECRKCHKKVDTLFGNICPECYEKEKVKKIITDEFIKNNMQRLGIIKITGDVLRGFVEPICVEEIVAVEKNKTLEVTVNKVKFEVLKTSVNGSPIEHNYIKRIAALALLKEANEGNASLDYALIEKLKALVEN